MSLRRGGKDVNRVTNAVPLMPSLSSLLFLLLYGGASLPRPSYDLWLHLANGSFILKHHGVPSVDPFSFTRAGVSWLNHEWLAGIIMAALQTPLAPGLFAVPWLMLPAAALWLLFRGADKKGLHPLAVIGWTLLAAVSASPAWLLRPHLVMIFCVAFWLNTLECHSTRTLRLWAILPVLTVVWANMHGSFFLGPGIGLIYATDELAKKRVRAGSRLLTVSACSFLAAGLINAHPVEIWAFPLRFLRQPALGEIIREWSPLRFTEDPLVFVIWLLLAILIAATGSKLRLRELLMVAFASYAVWRAGRNVAFFALFCYYPVAERLHLVLARATERKDTRIALWWRRFPALRAQARSPWPVVMLFLIVLPCQARWLSPATYGRDPGLQPVVEALRQYDMTDERVFHPYAWANLLLFELYDEGFRTFIDGRIELFWQDLLPDYLTIARAEPEWPVLLDRYRITLVVLPSGSRPARELAVHPDWQAVKRAGIATIFARSSRL